jgi:hypothetical protein
MARPKKATSSSQPGQGIRDILLPKPLSGENCVPDAGRFVGGTP